MRLTDGQERSDLEWLVELDTPGPAPPLIILPAFGPGVPPRFPRGRRHASGPGQGPHRPVLRPLRDEVPELDARLHARWRLTDEQLALLWQAEFPNSRTRYTMKSVRTERHASNPDPKNHPTGHFELPRG